MNRPGALAERLVVPAPFARTIDGVGPTDLVCIEPLTVVLASLRRLGGVPPSALVVGVGSQGMLMTLALLDRGVDVAASDVNAARVTFAASLGARPLETAAEDRFDLVVDSVGTSGSIDVAFAHLAVGGTLLILGLAGQPLELTAQAIVRRQAIIRGSLTYDHPGDFGSTVDLVREGRIRPGRIVTNEFPLADAQLAFETSGSAVGKTWIRVAS
jgi:alcohol dehydrogenase/L-iditol 2-dehydrogenase